MILLMLVSKCPFWVLHPLARVLNVLIFGILGYRKKVIHENLERAFPEKTFQERAKIAKQFYQNFCDMLVESLKSSSISKEELLDRCRYGSHDLNQEFFDQKFSQNVSFSGLSSHLANWEWYALSLCLMLKHQVYGVYKPLSNLKWDKIMKDSRERFGIRMIPIKKTRELFQVEQVKSFLLGLLADQAPHDFSKAYEFPFLGQNTFFAPGPGLITVQENLEPVWGRMKRVGRSRFECNLIWLKIDEEGPLMQNDIKQIERIQNVHHLTFEQSKRSFYIMQTYVQYLEQSIRENPADWLWTHRRWKQR